ncbi:MAG: hypothetical protein HKN42_08060 [Granulosicoccus sp.]|nr:hypothetical protein [Granulosicoccus sp.]
MNDAAGYRHRDYAYSLSEFGNPIALTGSEGWVLARRIPNAEQHADLMGCYPLFCCANWEALADDLRSCEEKYVSCVVVADPFGKHNGSMLRDCFPDLMVPFKQHFIVNLEKQPFDSVSSHHRRNAKLGLSAVDISVSETPIDLLDVWDSLYQLLIDIHDIRGIARFSRQSFRKLLNCPGVRAIYATKDDAIVGIVLFVLNDDNVAYYHLGAYSSVGYETKASFAIFSTAISYFGDMGVSALNLGAGAGVTNCGDDGLSRFKRGWSGESRSAYLCGRILDKEMYRKISSGRSRTDYFPLYRSGEFS